MEISNQAMKKSLLYIHSRLKALEEKLGDAGGPCKDVEEIKEHIAHIIDLL